MIQKIIVLLTLSLGLCSNLQSAESRTSKSKLKAARKYLKPIRKKSKKALKKAEGTLGNITNVLDRPSPVDSRVDCNVLAQKLEKASRDCNDSMEESNACINDISKSVFDCLDVWQKEFEDCGFAADVAKDYARYCSRD